MREVEREKLPWPIGCLPRAFSLILRDCSGNASSTVLLDALTGLESCESVVLSRPSSSSSPPIVNVESSGTSPREGDLPNPWLRALSTELLRAAPLNLTDSPASLRSIVMRSTSASAPSTVKSRRASKRLRPLMTASIKRRFSALPVSTHSATKTRAGRQNHSPSGRTSNGVT